MRSRLFRVLTTAIALAAVISSTAIPAYAKESSDNITGVRYEFSEKDDYGFDEGKGTTASKSDNFGVVSIKGDFVEKKEGTYHVQKGLLDVSYDILLKGTPADDNWHIVEDKTKDVNGVKLDANIKSGVYQTAPGVELTKIAGSIKEYLS